MQHKTFSTTLGAIRFGELEEELTKQVKQLVQAVQETGRVGTLNLSLKLRPGKNGGPMEIIDDYKVGMPKPEKGSTLMYPTAEGHLQRQDPRQGELDGIRSVPTPEVKVRSVGGA